MTLIVSNYNLKKKFVDTVILLTLVLTIIFSSIKFFKSYFGENARATSKDSNSIVARNNSNRNSITSDSLFLDAKHVKNSDDLTLLVGSNLSDNTSTQSLQKLPPLEKINISYSKSGAFSEYIPSFNSRFAGRVAAINQKGDFVFFTLDAELQSSVAELVSKVRADHVAVVAMEVSTGKVLAIGGKSTFLPNPEFHSGYPAASLFKVVTSTAAIEKGSINSNTIIKFRGGNYSLNPYNYLPNPRLDSRSMSVGEALGKSCNPVFGRVALNYLNPSILNQYAQKFGFNQDIHSEVPLPKSGAYIPTDNNYEFSRTGAGFGEVTLSPVHAATFMAGIANKGILQRPVFVDKIVAPTGVVIYKGKPTQLNSIMSPSTSEQLLKMMQYTTTVGTSRKEFMKRNKTILEQIHVAAKTGTLSGENPKGLNNWFIATAPIENPKVAVAVVVVNPREVKSKASHLGRVVLEKYFEK